MKVWSITDDKFLTKAYKFYDCDSIANHLNCSMHSLYSRIKKLELSDKKIRGTSVKYCNKCNKWYMIADFSKNTVNKDGLNSTCKHCSHGYDIIVEYKHCKCCNRNLPSTYFNKNNSSSDGLSYYCKDCDREKVRLAKLKKLKAKEANIEVNTQPIDSLGTINFNNQCEELRDTTDNLLLNSTIEILSIYKSISTLKSKSYTLRNINEADGDLDSLKKLLTRFNTVYSTIESELEKIKGELENE